MKVKVNEATLIQLNWMVALCEYGYGADAKTNRYSTDWAYGGPIIDRKGITLVHMGDDWRDSWKARMGDGHWQGHEIHGPTPLIAAMRCYVASKLGDEVDVPEELI